MEVWELLSLPLVQRALIAGLLLAVMAGLMGVFTTIRQAAFFGDAVAHSSLAGVALGLFVGWNPVLVALVYAVGVTVILPKLRNKTGFSFDNLLGVFLPLSMGLGVVLFASLPGYQPDLVSYLFGSVLAVGWGDVGLLAGLLVVVLVSFGWWGKRLSLMSVDEDYAKLLGLRVQWWETVYHVLLALTIVAGVRLVGIVLMNALLVVPASLVKLFVRSFKSLLWWTPVVGMVCVALGLVLSVVLDAPSGAMIALVSGALFGLAVVVRKLMAG